MGITLDAIKKLLVFTFLAAINVQACNKECNQKPPPFDCVEAMHIYAKTIEHYAEAVEQVNLIELKNFSDWLTENSNIHLTCDAYNQNKLLEPSYNTIFLESISLNNSIKLLIELSKSPSKPDKYFTKEVRESYQLMHNAAKVFVPAQ